MMIKRSLRDRMSNYKEDEKLKKGLEGNSRESDSRMFKLTKDEEGAGEVLIRFLPFIRENGDYETFVTRYFHSFSKERKGKKFWMNETCLSQAGQECPVCSKAWERYGIVKEARGKDEANKSILPEVQKQEFYTNILVVDDPKVPENNGKVFIYRFGKQILELIQKQANPSDSEIEEKGVEPFSIWDIYENHTFRLKSTPPEKKGGFIHYKDSYFIAKKGVEDISELLVKMGKEKNPEAYSNDPDENAFQALIDVCYDLTEFDDDRSCLKEDELYSIYLKTIGEADITSGDKPTGNRSIDDDVNEDDEKPTQTERKDIEKEVEKTMTQEEPSLEPTKPTKPIKETSKSEEKKESSSGGDDIDAFLDDLM